MHPTIVHNAAEGYVYVMECQGFYKIGWARTSPVKRRSLIQTGNPFPVTLVGVIEGSRMVESDWHDTFSDKRVRGEWFALTMDDVGHILHENVGTDHFPDLDGPPPTFADEVDWIPPDDEPA